jgi:hypothetical protein
MYAGQVHIMYEEKEESPINYRPLPGQPPVLNEAERKLKDIRDVFDRNENFITDSDSELIGYYKNMLDDLRDILNR